MVTAIVDGVKKIYVNNEWVSDKYIPTNAKVFNSGIGGMSKAEFTDVLMRSANIGINIKER